MSKSNDKASKREGDKKPSFWNNYLHSNSNSNSEKAESEEATNSNQPISRKPSLGSFVRTSSYSQSSTAPTAASHSQRDSPTEPNSNTSRYSMISVDSRASVASTNRSLNHHPSRTTSLSSTALTHNSAPRRKRSDDSGSNSLRVRRSVEGFPIAPRRDSSSGAAGYAEKSPRWFIVQISNRNSSLKSLYKYLTLLRNTLLNCGPRFIHDFVGSTVPHIGTNGISGIASLETALDRVCAPYLQKRAKSRPASIRSAAVRRAPSRYGDHIVPDEIRLKVLKCVDILMQTDYGMSFILLSTGLLRQILWCYSTPSPEDMLDWDKKSTATYLKLIALISRILGPACFIDRGLKDTVITVMCELQRHQQEPYPFHNFVQSLRNPGISALSSHADGYRPSHSYSRRSVTSYVATQKKDDPYDVVGFQWVYRTQAMVLINGLVSSGSTILKRSKMRKVLEKSSLRSILHNLLEEKDSAPKEFLKQVDLYMQDRILDMQESEKEFKEMNDKDSSFYQNMDVLFKTIREMPNSEMINHYVRSTLQNMQNIVRASEPQRGDHGYGGRNSLVFEMRNEDAEFTRREDIGMLLSLIERTSRSLAGSIKPWESDDIVSPTDRRRDGSSPEKHKRTEKLTLENVKADFYEAAGEIFGDQDIDLELGDDVVPNHKGAGKPPLKTKANVGALVEELESVKQQYKDSLEEQKALRKEVVFLQISLWTKEATAQEPEIISSKYSKEDLEALNAFQIERGNAVDDLYNTEISIDETPRVSKTSIKEMWSEIQRLQGLVNILEQDKREKLEEEEREKDALEAARMGLSAGNLYSPNDTKVSSSIPPPPPPGGPPGPPPPAPGGHSNNSTSIIIKSKVPMKPLQWEKLATHTIAETAWKNLFNSAYLDMDRNLSSALTKNLTDEKFISLFSKSISEVKKNSSSNKELIRHIVRFLDTKQSQNFEIMLNSFKLQSSVMRDGILKISDQIMNFDRTARLLSNIPSLEIMEMIASYDGPLTDLGIPEQFLRELSVVPRLGKRLECMAFRSQFFQEYNEIEPDIRTLMEAIRQVQESQKFAHILKLTLIIGNFLNGTSFRGDAHGFKISSLLNVIDTKANEIEGMVTATVNGKKNGISLLNSVVKMLDEHYPGAIDFLETDMPDVAEAAKIPILSLFEVANDLQSGLHNSKEELQEAQNNAHNDEKDRFVEVFTGFCDKTSVKMEVLKSHITKLKESLEMLFSQFVEDELDKHEEPQLFFVTLTKFSHMLKKAKRENEANDKALRKATARSFHQVDSVKWYDKHDDDDDVPVYNDDATAKGTFLTFLKPDSDPQAVLKPVKGMAPFSKRLTVTLPPGALDLASIDQSTIAFDFDENYKESRAMQVSDTLLRTGKSLAESRRIISIYAGSEVSEANK